jgi:hypothetical protein
LGERKSGIRNVVKKDEALKNSHHQYLVDVSAAIF